MTQFKELKINLQQHHGYAYNWKLIKEKDLSPQQKKRDEFYIDFFDKVTKQTTVSMCQNIDLIISSKIRTTNEQIQLEQFLNIIGTKLDPPHLLQYDHQGTTPNAPHPSSPIRQFEQDDEKRYFRIQEFIKTEKSYVETLKTLAKYVVYPLRANLQQQQKNSSAAILNTFKCQKIFLNIDQIMLMNEKFLMDLVSQQQHFGIICEKHMIQFEAYYRKYLLEQSDAQKLHTKEIKVNTNYRRFLSKAKDQPEFKRRRLQDILVEPVQRISRYSMMLRDILQLTPEQHPDYLGLTLACAKAQEIAIMADDGPTKIATMFLNLYQGIKDSPCSLINQKRSLVAHLDATEIHRVTNKPTRFVSLFLFTDKILVASRDSTNKELDLDDLLYPSSVKKSDHQQQLRFKGWADVESIELFHGPLESTFILTATRLQQETTITSFENYFYKGPRVFSIQQAIENASPAGKKRQKSCNARVNEFKDLYQKTRALVKQYEPVDKTYHKVWKDMRIFCNIYNPDTYISAKYKNDTALIYVDDNTINTHKLFTTSHPWIIGLVQPEDMKGFRFNICTKLNLPAPPPSSNATMDFESIFWNNLIYLDGMLRKSMEFSTQNRIAMYKPRTISRTSSIPSIGKLFKNDEAVSTIKAKSSPAAPIVQPLKRVPVHSTSKSDVINSNSISTLASSVWSGFSNTSSIGDRPPHDIMDSHRASSFTPLCPSPSVADDKIEAPADPAAVAINKDDQQQTHSISRTISSIGSSGSMIEDDGNDDDYMDLVEVDDCLTIKTPSPCHETPTKESAPPLPSPSNRHSNGFENEMQQQWKALITKYL